MTDDNPAGFPVPPPSDRTPGHPDGWHPGRGGDKEDDQKPGRHRDDGYPLGKGPGRKKGS
jgi:hypothetical protein